MIRGRFITLVITVLSCWEVAARADTYTFTNLATPVDGSDFQPHAVNNAGVAAGAYFAYEPWEMAVATPTSFTELPEFKVPSECSTVTNGCFLQGLAINDKGQVIAERHSYPYGQQGFNMTYSEVFQYSNNQWTEVMSPNFKSTYTVFPDVYFQGMNQAGQVLATYGHAVIDPRDPTLIDTYFDGSFLWTNGKDQKIIDPNAAADGTSVSGINDSGEIIGSYSKAGAAQGFIDNSGVFHPLNYPGAASTDPEFVNDSGEIVGTYTDSAGNVHTFLFSNGKFSTIPVSGIITGFNNSGEIVGYQPEPIGLDSNGFVYLDGRYQIVDYPGSATTEITGVNNNGTIVGFCFDCGVSFEGTLTASAAPEPGSLGLLTMALACVAVFFGRKRRN